MIKMHILLVNRAPMPGSCHQESLSHKHEHVYQENHQVGFGGEHLQESFFADQHLGMDAGQNLLKNYILYMDLI